MACDWCRLLSQLRFYFLRLLLEPSLGVARDSHEKVIARLGLAFSTKQYDVTVGAARDTEGSRSSYVTARPKQNTNCKMDP